VWSIGTPMLFAQIAGRFALVVATGSLFLAFS
jgi:hypothetical protein